MMPERTMLCSPTPSRAVSLALLCSVLLPCSMPVAVHPGRGPTAVAGNTIVHSGCTDATKCAVSTLETQCLAPDSRGCSHCQWCAAANVIALGGGGECVPNDVAACPVVGAVEPAAVAASGASDVNSSHVPARSRPQSKTGAHSARRVEDGPGSGPWQLATPASQGVPAEALVRGEQLVDEARQRPRAQYAVFLSNVRSIFLSVSSV